MQPTPISLSWAQRQFPGRLSARNGMRVPPTLPTRTEILSKSTRCFHRRRILVHQGLVSENLKSLIWHFWAHHILGHQDTDQIFFGIDPVISFGCTAPAIFPN